MSNPLLLDPEDVHRMLEQKEQFYLIDVREQYEWDDGHIQGALLMPIGMIANKMQGISKDANLVLYCEHGVRSLGATIALQQAGYTNVKSMDGGYSAWEKLYS